MNTPLNTGRAPRSALGITVFALIAIIGLYYVKWSPYYDRAFVAADSHAIGSSILTGGAASAPAPSWSAALSYAIAYGKAIWKAMVLGLLLGSAVQALLPRRWITRLLGSAAPGSMVAGGLLSLPGMMCTCCAAPVVAGLRKCQASPGAAAAFWLGNPVLNPATLIFMGFVLGWQWMGLRLVLGIVMVFALGWLLDRMGQGARNAAGQMPVPQPQDDQVQADLPVHPFLRWIKLLAGMSVRLIPEYVVLVLLLGAARAWLFPAFGPGIDNSLWLIVGLAIAGALFVIPTAGEIPIVQGMLALGVAAGPAAALLMTLPAISLPSLAMLAKSFRLRELAVLFAGVVVTGLLAAGVAIGLRF